MEKINEGTDRGGSIDMVSLTVGASNGVLATEVLVVSENVVSWLFLTDLLGDSRVEIFVS